MSDRWHAPCIPWEGCATITTCCDQIEETPATGTLYVVR